MDSFKAGSRSHRIFRESCQPVEAELACELNVTYGYVPPSLSGTLYRNGPGRFKVGRDSYSHLFDGDGMISSFQISNGKIFYRNAFVKTREFLKEDAAKRMLFRGFGSNVPGGILKNAFRMRFKNAANTNIISHNGKLFALWEGGWPHRISPQTLETLGRHSFGGELNNKANILDRLTNPELPFSAHPKTDPTTGSLYNFGLAFGLRNRLMIYKVDPNGKMLEPRFLRLKDLSFVHDFLITAGSKAIFFCTAVNFNLLGMLLGLRSPAGGMRVSSKDNVRIVVVDLDGPPGEIRDQAVQIFETPHAFIFHHVGAFEKDGKIHIYSAEMDSFPDAKSAQDALHGAEFEYPLTRLSHTTLSPGQKQAAKEILPVSAFEFPRIEDSNIGSPFSYFFTAGAKSSDTFPLADQIQKISIEGRVVAAFTYEPGVVGEPVFATGNKSKFILSVCYNDRSKKSELIILSEQNLSLIAIAELPHSQPLGFHGNWVNQFAQLNTA